MTKKNYKYKDKVIRAIQETCDIWDTDYNSDNWEPESMTIFVTWQLIVTLDSIRNSCDVYDRRTEEEELCILVIVFNGVRFKDDLSIHIFFGFCHL